MNIETFKQMNNEAQTLNLTIQKARGAIEENKKQFAALCAEYKAQYGVDVTMENIDALLADAENTVKAQYEAQAKAIAQAKESIYKPNVIPTSVTEGTVTPTVAQPFENAGTTAENVTANATVVTPTVAPVEDTPIVPTVAPVVTPTVTLNVAPVIETPVPQQTVTQPTVTPNVAPVIEPVVTPTVAPVPEVKVAVPNVPKVNVTMPSSFGTPEATRFVKPIVPSADALAKAQTVQTAQPTVDEEDTITTDEGANNPWGVAATPVDFNKVLGGTFGGQ